MATRELKKKRGAINPTLAGRAGHKGKEEKAVELVHVAPEKSSVDKSKEKAFQVTPDEHITHTTSLSDSQDENTKDTGQEKDRETPVTKDRGRKYESKGTEGGAMDSPRYLKSPREKSRERNASPFRRNMVEPLESSSSSSRTALEQSSLVSLQSESSRSSREAWPERKDSTSTVKSRTDFMVSPADSRPSSGKEQRKGLRSTETAVETVSIKSEVQQNAYIPYAYARSCITRIAGDMSEMKDKHIRIVKDIEKHYKAIEDETQVQFNGFVLMLRQQYRGKADTFRQVLELYRAQMAHKEEYWTETMQSMTERVNKLLKDRKVLLVNNREEVERLEKEKMLMVSQYTAQMDQEKSTTTMVGKDLEKKIQDLENDKKKLEEELEAEREEVSCLRSAAAASSTLTVAAVASVSAKEEKGKKSSVERSAPASVREGWRKDEELQKAVDERNLIREDLDRMGEERNNLMNKVKTLQEEVTRLSMESGEWQEKYRLLYLQVGESERVREQYKKLESQYKALALVVSHSPQSAKAAEDKRSQVEKDRADMEEERQRLQKEIERWEKEFRKKHKRDPTEEDRPDSAKELYVSLGEVEQMVESLECQKETLQSVQSGTVPPTPDLPAPATTTSGGVAEPQVSIVEVKVPDPDILVSLKKSQAAVDDLQSRLGALQDENAHLRSHQAELEAGADSGTDAAITAAAFVQGDDSEKVEKLKAELDDKESELASLHAEKRDMAKDMKKMMRQYAKLQTKLADIDPDSARLLQMVAVLVQSIHGEHEEAGRAVEKRLEVAKETEVPLSKKEAAARKALNSWDKKYKKAHGSLPEDKDRDEEGQMLAAVAEDAGKALDIKQLEVRALTLLTTGIYRASEGQQKRPKSGSSTTAATPETEAEKQISALDNRVIDLEGEKEKLLHDNAKLTTTVEDLEAEIADLKEQLVTQTSLAATVASNAALDDTAAELQREVDSLNVALQQERAAHDATRNELESVQRQLQSLKEDMAALQSQSAADRNKAMAALEAVVASKEEQLNEARKRNEELDKERMANVPMDTAKEIKNLQNKIAMMEKERTEIKSVVATHGAAILEVRSQLDVANKALESQRAANRDLEGRVKTARAEKEKVVKELSNQVDKKEQQRAALETKLKQLQAAAATMTATAATKAGGKGAKGMVDSEDAAALKKENRELNAHIKQMEMEARRGSNVAMAAAVAGAAPDTTTQKRHEKILKELGKRLEMETSKTAKLIEAAKQNEEQLKTLDKDVRDKDAEITKLKAELAILGVAAKEGVTAASRLKSLETENKKLNEEIKVLAENYNSERVLRKKYYNMVEDMKGKIRVYARARPLSTTEKERGNLSVVKSPDEYSIQVTSSRGLKEFQYDQVFLEDSTQERVFEDTNNLIQSAVDGYNVCIFAYGQTGSGKTFTMIGDRDQRFPGIAPRAFERIFELAEENKSKFDMHVTAYMLELYNDRLIDLFAKPNAYDEDKLEIKKDKKGMVVVQGAAVKEAHNAKELNGLFEEGSRNRHTAATKMNAESSRSHLVIGIVMESTNRSTGNVIKGKLSLVDLAGSERVGKTGATAEQLKEAMSINKSLSALGDVISALSSEQTFVPYRNNKLTMLMQDSLGGNAKTLMFVNISPADYNCDETVISLTYASRVKLITNDASKNADNKEIARLKDVIAKLKAGERVDEEEP